MTCQHEPMHMRTEPYDGTIYGADEDRRAHGGACHVERCSRCGAERHVNVNQSYREEGPWGDPFADRQARADELARAMRQARAATRERAVTLRHPSGRVLAASIADSGEIVIAGEHDPLLEWRAIAAALPAEFVEAAKALRRLVLEHDRVRPQLAVVS